MTKNINFKHLLWVLPLFFIWRLAFLFLTPPDLLTPFPHQELYRGALAKDIIEGLKMPLENYRPDNISGGFFIMSNLISLSFRLLGQNLFALKFPPLLISGLTLLCFYIVLNKKFNTSIAILFSFLYIFAPFSFISHSLMPLGDHTETIFITSLMLLLYLRMIPERTEKDPEKEQKTPPKKVLAKISPELQKPPINFQTALAALSLGVLAGFGTWFSFYSFLTTFTLILFWFMDEKYLFGTRRFTNFFFGFFIGLSPWIFSLSLNNLQISSLSEGFLATKGHFSNITAFFFDIRYLIPFKAVMSFVPYHLDPLLIRFSLFSYLFLFIYIVSTYIVRKTKEKTCPYHEKEDRPPFSFFFILYTIVTLIALQIANKQSMHSYIALHPIIYILIAYGISKASNHHRKLYKQAPFYVFILFIFLGILSTGFSLSPSHLGKIKKIKGYSYSDLVNTMTCKEVRSCMKEYDMLKEKISAEELMHFKIRLAYQLASANIKFEELERSVNYIDWLIDENLKPYFYYYLGGTVLNHFGSWGEAHLQLDFLENSSELPKKFLAVGGILDEMTVAKNIQLSTEEIKVLTSMIPIYTMPSYWRMIVQKLIPSWSEEEIASQTEFYLSEISSIYRDDFLEGIGSYYYLEWQAGFKEPYFNAHHFLKLFPPTYRKHILHGVGMAFEKEVLLNPYNIWKWEGLSKDLSDEELNQIDRGREYIHKFFKNPIAEPSDSYLAQ